MTVLADTGRSDTGKRQMAQRRNQSAAGRAGTRQTAPGGRGHKSFALVLSGGGARGLSHAGVLRALIARGYVPSAIVGVSMGAVVGSTYALNDDWYRELEEMDTSGFPASPDFRRPGLMSWLRNLAIMQRAARRKVMKS